MATVHFTPALKRFRPDIEAIEVTAGTVSEVVDSIEDHYPGLTDYLVEENRALRRHVNIFINDTFIRDRKGLTDRVGPDDHVHIIQALSGG
jgi:molybdopterin converting factor small subunit